MNRSVFMRWRRLRELSPKGERGVFAASTCGCAGLRSWRQMAVMTYFATTLTISPLKNAAKINEIGQALSGEYGIPWLPSDFKKKNGYKRSIELSAEYELYRQNYCGCAFFQGGAGSTDCKCVIASCGMRNFRI